MLPVLTKEVIMEQLFSIQNTELKHSGTVLQTQVEII